MAKVAVGKIERQYHQAVEQRIRRGVLRPSSRVYLDTLRVQLGLSSERAIAIEAEALMPYREKQQRLQVYEKALRGEIEYALPLDQEVIDELKELQKLLNLCDTDIRPTILSTLKATPVTSTDTAQVIKALLPEKSEKADPAIAYTPAADSPVPLAAPQCEVSLESEKGVDYSYLKKLLELHQWREADRETASVMLLAAGRTQAGWLDKESIEKFPRQDLHTIDQLWLRYSCGRFGFSVQKEIWLEVGDKVDYETEKKLGDRLGWRVNEKWIRHGEVVFDLSAPRGHLPLLGIWGLGILGVWWGWCVWGVGFLLSRQDL